MGALAGVAGAHAGGPRSLAQRGRAVWASVDVYVAVFAAAFLSALSGFMMGSTMGVHSQLRAHEASELGGWLSRQAARERTAASRPPLLRRRHDQPRPGLHGRGRL